MASKGTAKFIIQRASAIALLPLAIWFLLSLVSQVGASHGEMKAWLASPFNAIVMALFVVIGALHMRIGASEVIEDYIHSGLRPLLMALNGFFTVFVAGFAVFSVLTLAFG